MTFAEFLKTLRDLGPQEAQAYTFSELKAAYEAGYNPGSTKTLIPLESTRTETFHDAVREGYA